MAKDLSQLEKVIDLNKKLTAENTKLVTDIDGWIAEKIKHENEANRLREENDRLFEELEAANDKANHLKQWNDGWKAEKLKLQNDLEMETHFKCNERSMRRDLSEEITSIKSKWWYKLMTWGW